MKYQFYTENTKTTDELNILPDSTWSDFSKWSVEISGGGPDGKQNLCFIDFVFSKDLIKVI